MRVSFGRIPRRGTGASRGSSSMFSQKITGMTAIDLARIPYAHRFNGASLLIAKANRLSGEAPAATEAKRLLAAVAYFDMALLLMKPYDPNYASVVNWKCNALLKLEQYEEAVDWYREIVRISDETDGQAARNATAKLAEEMIRKHSGMKNGPLPAGRDIDPNFDEPPYCRYAEGFCSLLVERKFKKAHAYLAPKLREDFPVRRLKEAWLSMIGAAGSDSLSVALEQHMLNWPSRKTDEIGWCYFSVSAKDMSAGVSLIVARAPHNGFWVTAVEFGRP
jgi:tetratricopeptide (TPR) repeat protein